MEAFKHEIILVTIKDKYKCTTPLIQFEEKLEKDPFFRCHKSYIVHHKYIKKIEKDCLIMSDNTSIPLSKHRRKDFLEAFAKYIGDK